MAKLKRKEREVLYGRHSPAGYSYLQSKERKKLKRVEPSIPAEKQKKIAYYGQGRETADAMLRRLKRKK